ncbi:ATP-binding protein [Microlunatus speluncae]|uniref:ATP-binding protein n=1 Tax=Microlunatus speluncae TaxID=2594267 RepID=UPI00126674E3|nr:ATP-binding protein [Microlunatus speluncae]
MLAADTSQHHLVGRRQERQILADFIGTPEARVLVVSGPAGIGKSSLVEAALVDAEVELDVTRIRYTPSDEPFRTALDLIHGLGLRRFARGGGDAALRLFRSLVLPEDGSEADCGRVVDRLSGLISKIGRGVRRRSVIVHENFHLSDPATVELCCEVLRRADLWPWLHLVVVDSTLAERLSRHPTIELGGLDHQSCRALVAETTGAPVAAAVADQLRRLSNGNPTLLRSLAVQQTPDRLAGAAPLSVDLGATGEATRWVADRTAGLAPSELALLAVLADHRRIPAEVVAELGPDAAAAAARLAHHGLLRSDGTGWLVLEPLVAHWAETQARPAERERWHRRTGEAFGRTGDRAAVLGHRSRLPDEPAETFQRLAAVGRRLLADGESEAATRLLDVGLQRPPAGSVAELSALRARARLEQGFVEAALADTDTGLAHAVDPHTELALRVTELEARSLSGEHDPSPLTPDRLPGRFGSPAGEYDWLLLRAAHLNVALGALTEATAILDRVEAAADAPPALRRVRDVVAALIAVRAGGAGTASAVGLLRGGLPEDCPAGWSALVADMADVLLAAGEPRAARDLVVPQLTDPSRHSMLAEVNLTARLIAVDLWDGRYPVADRRIGELVRRYPPAGGMLPLAGAAVRIRAALGEPPRAEEAVALRSRQPSAPGLAPFDADLGQAFLITGDHRRAATLLDGALRSCAPLRRPAAAVRADLIEALVALGRHDDAVAVLRGHCQDLDPGSARTGALLARCRALTAAPEAADAAFDQALELCTDEVPEVDRGRTLLARARSRLAAEDRDRGLRDLRGARDLMGLLKLEGWVRHIDRLAQRHAAPPLVLAPPVPADPWRGVVRDSDRELLVGVATGLTHDQLARNSYVSRRTIANRLKTLYDLVGVGSKSELVMLVMRNPPTWMGDQVREGPPSTESA